MLSFSSFTPYGQLLMRIGGGLIIDFWNFAKGIDQGSLSGNYQDVGYYVGKFFSIIFDAQL